MASSNTFTYAANFAPESVGVSSHSGTVGGTMFFTTEQVVRLSEKELVEFLNLRIAEATGYFD
jgi:hypothetical protein